MSTTITLEEAQAQLRDLITRLAPGEEIVITDNESPVARLVIERTDPKPQRVAGACRGMLVIHSEDDEHLEYFKEYMP